ncbi:hypothetical protein TrST_g8987 [Triparma strigata]|uniref:DSBA-like thioredoxin domain-containing protein n=1 Tax=Triparma strigata TaxID=1606541 RepID=A0A9W7BQH8_9STRA|nr:hypothetical protein TrST_g8987 [Triparma strigata]
MIGTVHIKNAIASAEVLYPNWKFFLFRVPFLLEPGYIDKPDGFTEPHSTRMIRKFGSMENFVSFRTVHDLPGRAAEVNLDSIGFVQDNLSKRVQSSTLNSHRLVVYITKKFGRDIAETFYLGINKKHFVEGGVLNDKSMLLQVASDVGITGKDYDDLESYLNSEVGKATILKSLDLVERVGVHGIPTLILGGKMALGSGAQRAEDILNGIKSFIEGGGEGGGRLFGDILKEIDVV